METYLIYNEPLAAHDVGSLVMLQVTTVAQAAQAAERGVVVITPTKGIRSLHSALQRSRSGSDLCGISKQPSDCNPACQRDVNLSFTLQARMTRATDRTTDIVRETALVPD
jgi:hypothetical protein